MPCGLHHIIKIYMAATITEDHHLKIWHDKRQSPRKKQDNRASKAKIDSISPPAQSCQDCSDLLQCCLISAQLLSVKWVGGGGVAQACPSGANRVFEPVR